MARSQYIYLVSTRDELYSAPWAFTVKHEALRAIANSDFSLDDLLLVRVMDCGVIGLGNDFEFEYDIKTEFAKSGYIKK